jgi:hypothetical protein
MAENKTLGELLKELGLAAEYKKSKNETFVNLKDKQNKAVGTYSFDNTPEYSNIETIKPAGVFLEEPYRGKGVTSSLYKELEKSGGRIIPDDVQTLEGYMLHQKKGSGEKFGLSEDEYLKKLTPEEFQQREARKKALASTLENITNKPTPKEARNLGYNLRKSFEQSGQNSKNLQTLVENFSEALPENVDLDTIKSRIPSVLSKVKMVPLIGTALGAGIAAMSGEANAASAMPILGEADSLGPEKGSEDYAIENPQANPELRRKALESLLKK